MKSIIVILCLCGIGAICLLESCENAKSEIIRSAPKDMSQQMDVLSIYQNASGDFLRSNDFEAAKEMVKGMDSVMLEIINSIDSHPVLNKPFSKYYSSKMEEPMEGLMQAIEKKDKLAAQISYKLLVTRCNSCHNAHGVEERAHQ